MPLFEQKAPRPRAASIQRQYLTPSPGHTYRCESHPVFREAYHATLQDVTREHQRMLRLIDPSSAEERKYFGPDFRHPFDVSDAFPYCSDLGRDYERQLQSEDPGPRVGIFTFLEDRAKWTPFMDAELHHRPGEPSNWAVLGRYAPASQGTATFSANRQIARHQKTNGAMAHTPNNHVVKPKTRRKFVKPRRLSELEHPVASKVKQPHPKAKVSQSHPCNGSSNPHQTQPSRTAQKKPAPRPQIRPQPSLPLVPGPSSPLHIPRAPSHAAQTQAWTLLFLLSPSGLTEGLLGALWRGTFYGVVNSALKTGNTTITPQNLYEMLGACAEGVVCEGRGAGVVYEGMQVGVYDARVMNRPLYLHKWYGFEAEWAEFGTRLLEPVGWEGV